MVDTVATVDRRKPTHPVRLADGLIDPAVELSEFARLDRNTVAAIVRMGHQVELREKEYFVHAGDTERCALLLRGLVRTVRVDVQGRELTIHWGHPGWIIGFTTLLIPRAPTTVQAVTRSVVLEFPVTRLRDLAERDTSVMRAIAVFATTRLREAIDGLVMYAYGDLRSRVQLRLLEAACRVPPPATPLIAPISQEDLARSVGASRPAVARVLRQLRDEGLVRSMYRGILILRPEALAPARDDAAERRLAGL